ncbi:MAG TPA: di-heme oxidoredictase family protein [Steroidobacteraceae bacterium]|jgi:CxxC motif-containing protein (DUF1111 family)
MTSNEQGINAVRWRLWLATSALAVTFVANSEDAAGPDWFGAQLGGTTTLAIANENAYARPIPTTAEADLRKFTFGNRLFNTNWVTAPASASGFDGLGPVFNRVSCSSCHIRDGRGQPPTGDDQPLESMLIRLSLPGSPEQGPKPVPHYGDQLNEKAIRGVPAEGRTIVKYKERNGKYPDGTSYSLAVPSYSFADLGFGPFPRTMLFSARVAPPVFGLGLLDAVADSTLLALADEEDSNRNGISGRVNRVWNRASGRVSVGRFGWKANQPSLRQQIAGAALGDIGLTTSLFPDENVAAGQSAAAAAPSGSQQGEPELQDEFFEKLVFYSASLAVPAARNVHDPDVQSGALLFARIECTACHVPTLQTGDHPEIPQLSRQTIHPFTDLLLHDMGKDLADGRPDFLASGSEWRTPPLWGIGLTDAVNRHTRFLHDGRARSLEEAILWHGGEAQPARNRFMRLNKSDRDRVLQFLRSI